MIAGAAGLLPLFFALQTTCPTLGYGLSNRGCEQVRQTEQDVDADPRQTGDDTPAILLLIGTNENATATGLHNASPQQLIELMLRLIRGQ